MPFRCTVILLLVSFLLNIHISSIASVEIVPQVVIEGLYYKDAPADLENYKSLKIMRQLDSLSARPGLNFMDDDIIETSTDQKLKVSIKSEGIMLTLFPESKARIVPSRREIELLSGKLHYTCPEREKTINAPERFEFRAARNVFRVRGTEFMLGLRNMDHGEEATAGDEPIMRTEYNLEVKEGSVGIKPQKGTWKEVIVDKGFRAIGQDGMAPKVEPIMPKAQLKATMSVH